MTTEPEWTLSEGRGGTANRRWDICVGDQVVGHVYYRPGPTVNGQRWSGGYGAVDNDGHGPMRWTAAIYGDRFLDHQLFGSPFSAAQTLVRDMRDHDSYMNRIKRGERFGMNGEHADMQRQREQVEVAGRGPRDTDL